MMIAESAAWCIVALVMAYGCASVVPFLRSGIGGRIGIWAGWCVVLTTPAWVLLVPSSSLGLRALTAFTLGDLILKLVEAQRHWGRPEPSLPLRAFYGFLLPVPVLATVYPDHRKRLMGRVHARPEIVRLVAGLLGLAAAVVTLRWLVQIAWVRASFTLNHVAVLVTFVVAIESLSRAVCGFERLVGYDTTPIIRSAYLSRDVAEFWLRYNNRVHDWLHVNVYRPSGGRHAPIRSLVLVFLVSGLFHEVLFAVATSRLTGYQFAFFVIQAPAVVATRHVERLTRRGGIPGRFVAHGATILFFGVTSILFFEGVGRIFPFLYAARSPLP